MGSKEKVGCDYYYGAGQEWCSHPGPIEVPHRRPRVGAANPYKGENTDWNAGNGEMVVEHYCENHAEEVRRYWAQIAAREDTQAHPDFREVRIKDAKEWMARYNENKQEAYQVHFKDDHQRFLFAMWIAEEANKFFNWGIK